MRFLQLMLCESNGSPSSTRVISFLVVLTVLGLWAYSTVTQRPMATLSWEVDAMVASAMGIKAWQRGKEGTPGEGAGPTGGNAGTRKPGEGTGPTYDTKILNKI